MVGKFSNKEINSSSEKQITPQQTEDLLSEIRLIQQALTLEVEHDFRDLQGRKEHFSQFLNTRFKKLLGYSMPIDNKNKIDLLYSKFLNYSTSDKSSRRRIVIDLRRTLNQLSVKIQPKQSSQPPLIKHLSRDKSFSATESNGESLQLSSSLSLLKGVGPKIAQKLSSLGLLTVHDLLTYFPRDYVDYSNLKRIINLQPGETSTIIAKVRRCNAFVSPRKSYLAILELHLEDHTGRVKVTRFFAGRRYSTPAYIKNQSRSYPPGTTVAVSGLVKKNDFGISFSDPLIEIMESSNSFIRSQKIGRLTPIYSLTEGLTADRFYNIVDQILPLTSKVSDSLPSIILSNLDLPSKSSALEQIHKPDSSESLRAARKRLVFDEFFFLQLGFLLRRSDLRRAKAPMLTKANYEVGLVEKFIELLPFKLTSAQKRVLSEIKVDISKSEPMARLIQGDVGSGKTVIAIAALLEAVQSGWQAAFMAPTEVLAQQHYQKLCNWFPQLHVTVELLTGSTPTRRRRQVINDLANGSLKVLVGTHALIEDPVSFFRLGLVVVDEQHRFGVHQRNNLLKKGLQPHLLTMTATPIPRTLALSIHGDLDVSQLDEMPPGRTPIKTILISDSERPKAYELIRKEVSKGQRAYIVLPLVDQSEKVDLRSAVIVHKELSEKIFADLNVGLLHGRMKSQDKKSIIDDFVSGKCQVLVSTTVVEVGVDVPEASVMVIENAGRFGLAQLHQLRGRVGRSSALSYCLLISDTANSLAKQRLEVLSRSNDGFEIAEIDLQLRGPGQVLGTRQSGVPDFALASLCEDADILSLAREQALLILEKDPQLKKHPLLKENLDLSWNKLKGNACLN